MEKTGPHVSIKAETLFHIGSFPVSNALLTAWIITAILVVLALLYKNKNKSVTGIFNMFFRALHGTFEPIFGDNTEKYFKYAASFFLFIIVMNWSGLLPGFGTIGLETEHGMVPFFRAPTADLNMTLALGIFGIGLVQVLGIRALGFRHYMSKFISFANPINFFLGILEIISEISRVISLAFRLFGNVFAGEVLLTVVAFLIPILASLPFYMFEIFVGFMQAMVFSMLLAIFISVAVKPHH